jgi:hypothetical protein
MRELLAAKQHRRAHRRQMCVVHGDPSNRGNVRMTTNRVALIEWDEAHVDVPDLDLYEHEWIAHALV